MKTITDIEESNGIKVDKDIDIEEFMGKTIIGRISDKIVIKDYKIFFKKDYWIFDMTVYLKGSLILVDYQEFPVSYKVNGIPKEMTNTIRDVIDLSEDLDLFNSVMGVRSSGITIDQPTITTRGYEYPNTLTSTGNGNFIATSSSSSIFESLSDLGNPLVNITNNYVKSKL